MNTTSTDAAFQANPIVASLLIPLATVIFEVASYVFDPKASIGYMVATILTVGLASYLKSNDIESRRRNPQEGEWKRLRKINISLVVSWLCALGITLPLALAVVPAGTRVGKLVNSVSIILQSGYNLLAAIRFAQNKSQEYKIQLKEKLDRVEKAIPKAANLLDILKQELSERGTEVESGPSA